MSAHRALFDLYKAPFLMVDPGDAGTIRVDRFLGVVPVVTGGAEGRTLAVPTKAGLLCAVLLDTDGGDLTLTVTSGYNQAGATAITFDDAGDWVLFASVKIGANYRWRVVAQEGTNANVTNVTATTGTITTLNNTTLTAPAVAAEHGAGAIGTGVAPVTTRRVENGHIITEFKIDLTGLASSTTEHDAIGLAAGTPAAFINRNVLARMGVIYKIEMICLETPATGVDRINLVANASGTLSQDDAAGEAYGVQPGADLVAGQVRENLVQGLTADHYFYLTSGKAGTAATYTGGQLLIRFHGHPVLT